ncbi:competence protein CoiA [Psychrobacillus sp. NPDC093180]|uniref:competence protein CoiA n=1 Tax=Psychrobacillus sp. NPDC093180 TaxID=3364489 RepID=UPI00380190DB
MTILTAQTKQGEIIISANYSRQFLNDLKGKSTFQCLQCKEEVILKSGPIKIPHFAHKRRSECIHSFSEGESEDHLNGKLQLHTFFQQRNSKPQLESYIPNIKQRPDILVHYNHSQVAVEYQCSHILPSIIEDRNRGYKQHQIEPLWILRTPTISEFPPQEIGIMQLSAFRQQFFLETPTNGKMIISYCPQTKFFHYISNPVHIQSNKYIVKVKKLPMEKQTWPFAVVKRLSDKEYAMYFNMYRKQRFKHINNLYFYNRKGVQNPFLEVCYRWRMSPREIPIFIGIPTAFAESFHVHAVEWQIQWIDYLNQIKVPIEEANRAHCEVFLLYRPIGLKQPSPIHLKAVQTYLSILQECLIKSDTDIYKWKVNRSKMYKLLYSDFLAK